MVTWFPLSKTMDTLQTVDKLSKTLLPYARLKAEARRYVVGERPPHYPVPAIRTEVEISPDRVVVWVPRLTSAVQELEALGWETFQR